MRGSPPGPTRISTEWGSKLPVARSASESSSTDSVSVPSWLQTAARSTATPASSRDRPMTSGGRSGEVSTATFEAVRTALVISSSGRLSAETTTASSHGSATRAKASETDDAPGRMISWWRSMRRSRARATPKKPGSPAASTHTRRAYSTDWLHTCWTMSSESGPTSSIEGTPVEGRAHDCHSASSRALATTTSASVRARRASGPRRSRRSSATPTTVTGLRSGTAPRSARPTRTAGGVVRRGAHTGQVTAWRRAVGGTRAGRRTRCARRALQLPRARRLLGPRTGSGRVRRRARREQAARRVCRAR